MRVSLCMIARNEAATLPGCLTSVADLVDEIVVVDTGSVDNTRAVAEQLGARVHDFAWVDHFGAARNESLRHATGEWILWLDGDEHFDANNRVRLRALFESLQNENAAYFMNQRSPLYSAERETILFEQCRLFRNLPAIRWHYRVHEQIQPAVERSGGTVRSTGIFIEHTGYQDPKVYRRKLERNLRLLVLEDQERPNDPFTLMNLGWAYQELGQSATALTCYERSQARCSSNQSIARKLQSLVVRGHLALGQRQQALTTCRAARTFYPDDVELSFLEAVLLSELGDLPAAEALLLRLLNDRPADHSALGANPGMRGYMARHNLARLYRAQGRDAEAEAQWRTALADQPGSLRLLFELGLLYVHHGRTVETEPIVQQLDALGPIGAVAATMLRAQSHLNQNDVAAARGLLETAVASGPPTLEPRVMLSRLLLKDGADPEATKQALHSVLALNPNHEESRQQLETLLKEAHRPMRVSLCVIARNEAANLPACLGTVADLVDESIVVDTGSTDQTREVARQLGARVYDFAWQDDFAAARNESIRPATGDWIFWLDADERLNEQNRQKLRALLANLQDENSTFVMKQCSVIDWANGDVKVFEQARLFRNRSDIRWRYRVHEQILPALERSGSIPHFTDLVIDHLGYTNQSLYLRKQDRNLRLLRRQDAEQPDDSLTQFNLGLTLLTLGQKAEALLHCRRSLELAPIDCSWVRKLYILLAGNAADSAEALAWCRQGLARFPNDTEILFEQASLLAAQGDLGGAETNLLMLLRIPESAHWASGVDQGLRGYKARHSLALVYRGQGRAAEAEAQWRAVLAERPGYVPAARALGELILGQQRGQELEQILHRPYSLPNGAEASASLQAPAQQQESQPAGAGLQSYSREFYIQQHLSAYRSAKEVVPHVLELLRPQCIIDVGCGSGSWLAVFREHGITDVLGVDSAGLDLDLLQIPREQFLARDLAQPLKLSRQFDLALSLEVAEHLPAECASTFVASLVRLAPVVLFSAAVPYQGGTHHINEQWPGYWIDLFEQHGYLALDCLRDKVWVNDRVDWWYRQNMLLFCLPEVVERNAGLRGELVHSPTSRLARVHPKLFLQIVGVNQDLRRQLALRHHQQVPLAGDSP